MSSLTLCPQGRRTANTPLPVRRSSGLVPPDSSPAAIKGAHATPTPLTQRCLKTMFRRFADVRRLREWLPFLRGWAPAEADRKLSSTTSSPEPSLAPRGARYSGLEARPSSVLGKRCGPGHRSLLLGGGPLLPVPRAGLFKTPGSRRKPTAMRPDSASFSAAPATLRPRSRERRR